MDSRLSDKSTVPTAVSSEKECKHSKLVVLYQNICSLRKKTELEVLLCSELKHVDVICLTEHWQSDQKLNCTNTVDFKLVSALCRDMVLTTHPLLVPRSRMSRAIPLIRSNSEHG
jgi:hypothetical protein